MVLLRQQQQSQKRSSSSFVPPFPPPKIPKPQNDIGTAVDAVEKMVSILAEGGCTLVNPLGPPSLPSDPYKLHRHLSRLFSSTDNRFVFLSSFSSYIQSSSNLRSGDWMQSKQENWLARRLSLLLRSLLNYLDVFVIIKKGGRSFPLLPQRIGHYTIPKEMNEVCNWLTARLGLEVKAKYSQESRSNKGEKRENCICYK